MDDIVSRPHAEIRFENCKWWVYDLNSTNGIFVDGKKVEQIPLANNTRIILGQFGPALFFPLKRLLKNRKQKCYSALCINMQTAILETLMIHYWRTHHDGPSCI